jgi:NDP-sugar pyrophosphorylase family protein
MKAMILAAGKGSRLRPITDKVPKVLVEINGVPLLEHAILFLKHYGVKEVVINLHHHAEQIVEFLRSRRNYHMHIDFSDETEELLDTGGGLNKARWFFTDGKPFFVMASDIVTDLDLAALRTFHYHHRPLATLAVKKRKSSREFLFDETYLLAGWHSNITGETRLLRTVRKPHAIAFSAIQVVDPVVFNLVTEKGPFSLTDLYLRLAGSHEIKGFEHNDSHWFEFGRIENLKALENEALLREIYLKHV